MKMRKKIMMVALSAMIMLGGMVFMTSNVDAATPSGTCGAAGNESNVTWSLDDAGTLTISGTGAMANYEYGGTGRPWNDYINSITTVVIENGVTTIGDSAFQNFTNATSIVFDVDSQLKTIGNYACAYMKETTVTIPDSVETIGKGAFVTGTTSENSTLTSVNFGENSKLKSIGHSAFSFDNIETLVLPEGLETLENYAFTKNIKLKSVTLPSTLKTIGTGVFTNSNSLESITIPESVQSIGTKAFINSGIKSLTIKNPNVDLMDEVFESCESLETVELPDTMVDLGDKTFYHCKALKTIKVPEGITTLGLWAFADCQSLENVELPSTLTTIPSYSFWQCYKLSSITLPGSLTTVGANAFDSCTVLEEITIPCTKELIDVIDGKGITVNKADMTYTVGTANTPGKIATYHSTKLIDGYKEPTYDEEGYTGDEKCTACGEITRKGEVISKIPKYELVSGAGQKITAGKATDLTFKTDGPLDLLDKVYVNGIELNQVNYTTAGESTVVTLKKDYIDTLPAGTYELKLTYTNGSEVKTDFTVTKADTTDGTKKPDGTSGTDNTKKDVKKTPATGDATHMELWMAILALAAGTTVIVLRKKTHK